MADNRLQTYSGALEEAPSHEARTFTELLNSGGNPAFSDPVSGGGLTLMSPEVEKEDVYSFHRIFPDGGGGRSLSEIELNNAIILILKNRTKWKEDPFTDQEIREMTTNPHGRLGSIDEFKQRLQNGR